MKWNRFRLKTRTEAEDVVSSILADLGIRGVEIEDNVPLTEQEKEQMFVDILPPSKVDDGVAYLSFYLEEEDDKEQVLEQVREALEEMQEFMDRLRNPRQKISIGSITGNSIFISFMWMTF